MKIVFPILVFFLASLVAVRMIVPLEWSNAPTGLFILAGIAFALHFVFMSAVDGRAGVGWVLAYLVVYGIFLYATIIVSWILGMKRASESVHMFVQCCGIAFIVNAVFSWTWYASQRYRQKNLSDFGGVLR